jgi:putative hydrolase
MKLRPGTSNGLMVQSSNVVEEKEQDDFSRKLKLNMKQRILDQCIKKYEFIGDYHLHTTYSSNGFSTLSEYIEDAKMKGFKEIAITDACRWDKDIDGYFRNFSQLPDTINGIRVRKGIESYILPNGQLTTSFETLRHMSWVTACLSRYKGYRPDVDYTRVIHEIISDSRFNVKVLGHVSNWVGVMPLDGIIRHCKNNGVLIEVDSGFVHSPDEIEKAEELLALCRKYEARVIINSAARHTSELGEFYMLFIPLTQLEFPDELIYNLKRG